MGDPAVDMVWLEECILVVKKNALRVAGKHVPV